MDIPFPWPCTASWLLPTPGLHLTLCSSVPWLYHEYGNCHSSGARVPHREKECSPAKAWALVLPLCSHTVQFMLCGGYYNRCLEGSDRRGAILNLFHTPDLGKFQTLFSVDEVQQREEEGQVGRAPILIWTCERGEGQCR